MNGILASAALIAVDAVFVFVDEFGMETSVWLWCENTGLYGKMSDIQQEIDSEKWRGWLCRFASCWVDPAQERQAPV